MAISFNGTSDFLALPISEFYDQFTISLFFSTTNSNETETILSISDPTADDSYLAITKDNDNINYYRYDSTSNTIVNSSLGIGVIDGNYHHIVVTDDGVNAVLYVDGTSYTETNNSFSLSNIYSYISFGILGTLSSGERLGGNISEFALWNTVLGSNEISALKYVRPICLVNNLKMYFSFMYGPNDLMGERPIVEASSYTMSMDNVPLMISGYYNIFPVNVLNWYGHVFNTEFVDRETYDYIIYNTLYNTNGVGTIGNTYVDDFNGINTNGIVNSRRLI